MWILFAWICCSHDPNLTRKLENRLLLGGNRTDVLHTSHPPVRSGSHLTKYPGISVVRKTSFRKNSLFLQLSTLRHVFFKRTLWTEHAPAELDILNRAAVILPMSPCCSSRVRRPHIFCWRKAVHVACELCPPQSIFIFVSRIGITLHLYS